MIEIAESDMEAWATDGVACLRGVIVFPVVPDLG